ncbi:MAG: hypothetical protein CMJ18_28180 [Phycisphaeraceae bacterium]|nr:hypothetical protein [Phycisphaeraceae bacterium]
MIILAAVIGALGSYLYKSGADAVDGTVISYLASVRILTGAACYVGVMVLFVAAYRVGGGLTVLYPVYATTFIFAAIIALFAYGTPIRLVNIGGMALLVFGMYLMGRQ